MRAWEAKNPSSLRKPGTQPCPGLAILTKPATATDVRVLGCLHHTLCAASTLHTDAPQIDFTVSKEMKEADRARKEAPRFLSNPEEHWGPKVR